jgi:hypothetical protein
MVVYEDSWSLHLFSLSFIGGNLKPFDEACKWKGKAFLSSGCKLFLFFALIEIKSLIYYSQIILNILTKGLFFTIC